MKIDWKKILPYVVGVIAFAAIAIMYGSPAWKEDKVLLQGDINNWKGAAREARTFYEKEGYSPWWTNSMFSGMPTYQITGSLPTGEIRTTMENIAHFGFAGDLAFIGVIFAYFCGFFLMLRCFRVNPWLSIIGGIAIGFSTYFFLIIPAGHMTKAVALGFLAPVIGGFYAIFRKRYWLGAPLVVLYGIMSITLHPQMTYYIFMLIGVMACAELYYHIREKRWKDLGISVGVLAFSLLLVVGTKISWMEMNQSYLKETMRGGHSELTREGDDKSKPAGLDFDYATQWSYGRGETMTLLIPNWEGGASGYNVGVESDFTQTIKRELDNHNKKSSQKVDSKKIAEQYSEYAPTFHGDKPFTSGPVYIGAIICFLFVLGLLIVPGPYKWALLVATLFSITLAWGKNMTWLTELFFNHFPMYNKFRAVESILVVAEITMPLLGVLALQQIVDKRIAWNKLKKYLWISGGLTGGLCLLCILFSGSIDVASSNDKDWVATSFPDWLNINRANILNALLSERTAMLKADAWRSFIFIALGFAAVYWYAWQTQKEADKKYSYLLYGALFILILADMIPVNKRFFGKDSFVTKHDAEKHFAMQPYEQEILKDTSLDYRVLNLATNTFNDARTSYRLKSIGGYSAAKLRRYQDLIDEHLYGEMNSLWQTIYRTQGFSYPDPNHGKAFPVLNMLNMKYVVVPTQNGNAVIQNPYAMGNCWFVNDVKFVNTPDEECAALREIDLSATAVADKSFANSLNISQPEVAPLMAYNEDSIRLISYKPNCLEYEAWNENNKVAVFSEIYYPHDWHLYMVNNKEDKVEIPLARVNYSLRAAVIPAGHHKLIMQFEPHAVKTDKWCMALLILSFLLSAGALSYPLWKNKLHFKKQGIA